MKAILKQKFTKADLESGNVLVTAINFSTVKDWSKFTVSGDKFLVDRAVKLGATKPKAKKSVK